MDPQARFLLLALLIPLISFGIVMLGHRHARRAVIVVSSIAIALGPLNVLLFVGEAVYLDFSYIQTHIANYQDPVYLTMRWLQGLDFDVMILIIFAAAMLSLLDASRRRVWAWVALIVVGACLSYVASQVWGNVRFMRQDPFFAAIFHVPAPLFILMFNALTLSSPLATLIYGILMRPDAANVAPVTSAPAPLAMPAVPFIPFAPHAPSPGPYPAPVPAAWNGAPAYAPAAGNLTPSPYPAGEGEPGRNGPATG